MGVFRPFIRGVKSLEEYRAKEAEQSHDQPVTPADLMTYSRPLLAAKAGKMLLNGEVGVTPVALAMAASDLEGYPARLIDKLWPDSGYGTTAHGARNDTYADAAALLVVGAATLKAPRVTRSGKAAMAAILGQEGFKAAWALRRNREYQDLTGQRLELPSSLEGKEAMAEKLTGAVFAIATNDTDNTYVRAALSAGALYFAGVGSWRGERARRNYDETIEGMFISAAEKLAHVVHLPVPEPALTPLEKGEHPPLHIVE